MSFKEKLYTLIGKKFYTKNEIDNMSLGGGSSISNEIEIEIPLNYFTEYVEALQEFSQEHPNDFNLSIVDYLDTPLRVCGLNDKLPGVAEQFKYPKDIFFARTSIIADENPRFVLLIPPLSDGRYMVGQLDIIKNDLTFKMSVYDFFFAWIIVENGEYHVEQQPCTAG